MAPVTCTGRVSMNAIRRLGLARQVAADNYKLGGESGRANTFTVTIVVTPSATDPALDTCTIDYSST